MRLNTVNQRQAVTAQPVAEKSAFVKESVSPAMLVAPGRRSFLQSIAAGLALTVLPSVQRPAPARAEVPLTVINTSLAPDQSKYDPSDQKLRDAAQLLQQALNAQDVREEERLWTKLIDDYSNVDAPWRADVIGRAYGNRGNARSRQGKWEAALKDYNTAIELCPWSVDPVLNRGVAYENTNRLEEAEADYKSVLQASPQDPSAWNNLGNTYIKMERFEESLRCYNQAVRLAPEFSFAVANRAECMFQLGDDKQAFREMRNLLRRYPEFAEVRASLTAALWAVGLEAEAENEFQRISDPRYSDVKWLKEQRHWPPRLYNGMVAFLSVRSVKRAA